MVVLTTISLTFVLVRLSGDPTSILLPQDATQEQREALRDSLGLNDSLLVQFVTYLGKAATGDFGTSYFDQQTVTSIVGQHLPNTLLLAGSAMALALIFAIPLGVMSAIWRGGILDRMVQLFAVVGASMPSFWVGLLLIQVFAIQLGLLPTYGSSSWSNLVLPCVTLSIYAFPSITRLTRSSILEVLPQNYVTVARAKGMPEHRVISRTVMRNGMVPIVTLFALELGNLIGGAVLTETVFAWEGIGRLALNSISRRDFPVVQGVVVYVALGFVIITLLAEITVRLINPRLRDK
ncbi:ABC transporter permease [Pokkaliibacter plantistimulans]|uniref:ABC transporter permease n=2 Tax=Pseudomonadota TaxID=1224 RepID=A0A2S5KIR0_9PROT|nr:ABC transporter permease [Pokkaliibacter plantistimulans]